MKGLVFVEGRGRAGFGNAGLVFGQRHGFDLAGGGEPDDDEEFGAAGFRKFFEDIEMSLGDATQLEAGIVEGFDDLEGGRGIVKEHEFGALSPEVSVGFSVRADGHDGMIWLGRGTGVRAAHGKIDIKCFKLLAVV